MKNPPMTHRHPIWSPLAIAACVIAAAGLTPGQSIKIPTSLGAGADTYISGGTNVAVNYGASEVIQATTESANSSTRRTIYLKFDLSAVAPSVIENATGVALTLHNGYANATNSGTQTIRVYGLNKSTDPDLDTWGEGSITAENAPAITSAAQLTLDPSKITDLGTLNVDFDVVNQNNAITFSNAALQSFLETDLDALVTLIVTRESTSNVGNFGIRTKEYLDSSVTPTLTIGSDTYYWDSDDSTPGFGDTNGTWSATTAGTTTRGWATDSTGATVVDANSVTTSALDTVNFGTTANPYGTTGKTVTVNGMVNAGTVVFGNTNGAAVALNGGTVSFGTNGVITNNSNAGFTWNSAITGAGTSLTINGTAGQSVTNVFNKAFNGSRMITIGADIRFDQNANQPDGAGLTYNVLGNLGLRDTSLDLTETTYQIGELTGSGFISAGGGANDGRRVIVGAKNTDSTFSGLLRFSTLGFTKEGSGTLTLTNTGAHSYGLSTVISAGTLQLGDGGSIGGLSNTSGITNDAALIYNHSNDLIVSRAMTGTGTLEKKGVGKLTLTGANSYQGATTVSAGTLSLAGPNLSNETSNITIAATGATLDLNFAGTDTVDKLFIGATPLQGGKIYGAMGSVDPMVTPIPQITGTGTLTVTSSYPEYTLLLDETFLNGERTFESLPTTAAWYGSNSSLDQIANGSIRSSLVTTSSRHVFTHFTPLNSPYTLVVGGKITLSFDFNLTKAVSSGSGIRLGLLNSRGTRISGDAIGTSSASFADDVGYGLFINPVNDIPATGGLGVMGRVTAPGITGLVNQATAWTSYTTVDNPLNMVDAQTYSLSLSVKRTASGTQIRGALSGGNLGSPVNFSYDDVSEEAFVAFDKFAIGVLGNATSGTVEDPAYLTLSNVGIIAEYSSELTARELFDAWAGNPSITFTGDANGDGVEDGVAWLLGAASPATNAAPLLPAVAVNSGELDFGFPRLVEAERGTALLKLQHGPNLSDWTTVIVPDTSGNPGGIEFVVNPAGNQVQATIPAGIVGDDDRYFIRLLGELE